MLGFFTRNRLLFIVALTALAADQITKAIVVATIDRGHSWPATGYFRFTHIGNTGSAFGLFDDQNTFLILASFVGLGILVYFYRAHPNPGRLVKVSMGLMLAGAFGNLTDRVFRDHVVDFVDVGPFWIFNIADSSISTGLVILAASVLLFDQGPGKPVPDLDADPDSGADPGAGADPDSGVEIAAVTEQADDDRPA
jgi:signal peptidase II